MHPFFSIIIPVYNVEQYLEECLDSVIGQNFHDCELICVDDGSTDGSNLILEKYKKKFSNIRVKTIANNGTAVARNEGIKMAKGEYILFVDSDDWITPNSLQTIYAALQGHLVDVISFNGQMYNETDKNTQQDKGRRALSQKGWNYYNSNVLIPRKFHFVCVVIRAYNRTFLLGNNLLFEPGILHEDNLFTPRVFYYAEMVAEIPDHLYYYRIRKGSKMQEYNYRQISDKCEVNNRLGDFFFSKQKIDLSKISRIIASDYTNLYNSRVKKAIGNRQKEITGNINREHFRQACISNRHRFLYSLISIHPGLFRIYSNLTKKLHKCLR